MKWLRRLFRTVSKDHMVQQVIRFVRLTVLAAVPSVVDLVRGGAFDWKTQLAFILPFAEVAYRQVFPTTPPAPTDDQQAAALTNGSEQTQEGP